MLRLSALILAVALSAVTASADPVVLVVGAADDRHATFTFAEDRTAPDALVIETRRAGNPGAEIRVWIDKSASPLLARILTAQDCEFDDAGAVCRIEIAGSTPAYNAFVYAFQRGLKAHLVVRNASVMEMQDDASLAGFTAAYGG
jgi:hypothetical protein